MDIKIESKILIRLAKFFAPFIIGFGTIGTVGVLLGKSLQMKYWALVAGYFFPPLGKESVIPIGVAGGEITIPILNKVISITPINPIVMALSIAFVDIIVALFLVWNYDFAKKVPLIGHFIAKVETIGRKSSSKYSWIKPLRFIGIILFVMVPFQGSGGLVGSIVGRLIGMKPWNIFFAISVGAVTGCLMIGYFADAILSVFVTNFLLGVLIIVILLIIAIMAIAYKTVNKNKENGNSR
ncbi:MAG: small multi-drug export protein [Candidatus Thermoplasmatota archaeon]|nr:small multi-drug export protein [Candidatus Thermoplasmatota archaeon]